MAGTIVEPAEVTAFLERLLDDGGMRELEPDVRAQMLEDLRLRFQNKLFAAVVMKLPERELPALDELITAKTPAPQIQEFLRTRIENLDQVMADAMIEFRKLYVKEA